MLKSMINIERGVKMLVKDILTITNGLVEIIGNDDQTVFIGDVKGCIDIVPKIYSNCPVKKIEAGVDGIPWADNSEPEIVIYIDFK